MKKAMKAPYSCHKGLRDLGWQPDTQTCMTVHSTHML